MRHSVLFPALAVLVTTACAGDSEGRSRVGEAALKAEVGRRCSRFAGGPGRRDHEQPRTWPRSRTGEQASPCRAAGVAALPVDAMLIRTGNASIEVRSLDPAIDQVRALAGQMGGFVANTSIQAGDERLRSASIELRIPNDRFDAACRG